MSVNPLVERVLKVLLDPQSHATFPQDFSLIYIMSVTGDLCQFALPLNATSNRSMARLDARIIDQGDPSSLFNHILQVLGCTQKLSPENAHFSDFYDALLMHLNGEDSDDYPDVLLIEHAETIPARTLFLLTRLSLSIPHLHLVLCSFLPLSQLLRGFDCGFARIPLVLLPNPGFLPTSTPRDSFLALLHTVTRPMIQNSAQLLSLQRRCLNECRDNEEAAKRALLAGSLAHITSLRAILAGPPLEEPLAYMLFAAAIASFNPPSSDARIFCSSVAAAKRRNVLGKKAGQELSPVELVPHPFATLRLWAIYQFILPVVTSTGASSAAQVDSGSVRSNGRNCWYSPPPSESQMHEYVYWLMHYGMLMQAAAEKADKSRYRVNISLVSIMEYSKQHRFNLGMYLKDAISW